jgi:hypothetical protein
MKKRCLRFAEPATVNDGEAKTEQIRLILNGVWRYLPSPAVCKAALTARQATSLARPPKFDFANIAPAEDSVNQLIAFLLDHAMLDFSGDLSLDMVKDFLRNDDSPEARPC